MFCFFITKIKIKVFPQFSKNIKIYYGRIKNNVNFNKCYVYIMINLTFTILRLMIIQKNQKFNFK